MNVEKPTVELLGKDGNAFAIIAECSKSARRAGWSQDELEELHRQLTSGDYDHLLAVVMKYFEVE